MPKLVVDCSLPVDHPEHAKMVKLTEAELKRRPREEKDAAARGETKVRGRRNTLLASSDWTQAQDSPLSDAKRAEWAEYRQSLRNWDMSKSDLPDPPS